MLKVLLKLLVVERQMWASSNTATRGNSILSGNTTTFHPCQSHTEKPALYSAMLKLLTRQYALEKSKYNVTCKICIVYIFLFCVSTRFCYWHPGYLKRTFYECIDLVFCEGNTTKIGCNECFNYTPKSLCAVCILLNSIYYTLLYSPQFINKGYGESLFSSNWNLIL